MTDTLTPTRKQFFAICLTLFTGLLFAQKPVGHVAEWLENQPGTFQELPLLHLSTAVHDRSDAPKNATFLEIDPAVLRGLAQNAPDAIEITVPTADGNDLNLRLARTELLSADFKVTVNDGREVFPNFEKPVFYRGIVDGEEGSVASVTVFGDDLQAMVLTGGDNLFIEKNGSGSDEFILFNKKDAPNVNAVECESAEAPGSVNGPAATERGVGCKVVQIYFECDYQMFLDKGSSVANVTSYVTGLFGQVATLYANENIAVEISQINVWNTADPYISQTTTSGVLNQFKAAKGTNFTGTIAHFLSTRSLGGGIGYIDVLCNKAYAFSVSQVYNTYANVPTYSWSVEVVTHELGHNFGAWHTHSCNWPGGPIDNCYAVEGACAAGPAPTNGGTIMSYCHLTGAGINFANGFGPVAGNYIRSKVLNSACLAQTGVAPSTFLTSNITTSGARFSWGAVTGATMYEVQYKTSTATTWTTGGTTATTSMDMAGLLAGTSYQWQVKTDCSAFSTSQTFTTTSSGSTCAQPSALATSNITTSAATLSWAAVAGASSYSVQYKTSAATVWTTSANLTTTSINLSGLSSATNYVWVVKANCSINSVEMPFTTATVVVTSCSKPVGMATTALLPTAATVVWAAVPGATSYTVKYKLKSASNFTVLPAVTTTSQLLSGLTKGKQYNWQVKANCSAYTSSQNFTTPTALIIGDENNPMPEGKTLALSPNPIGSSDDMLKVRYFETPPVGAQMLLCDAAGRIVGQSDFTEGTMRLSVAELPYGIYTVMLIDNGHRLAAQRFVRIE